MEQFLIVPLNLTFGLDNYLMSLFAPLFLLLVILVFFFFESGSIKGFGFFRNAGLFSLISFYFIFIKDVSVSILGPVKGLRVYPFICCLFFFIFTLNLLGLMPYGFSVTSHLSCTFGLSFTLLLGAAFLMFNLHGKRAFAFFLPSGTPFALIPFIVPVEIISYLVRFISLPARLFANMVAGHILIKIFVGLGSSLLAVKTLVGLFLSFIPLFVLILLLFLEIGVALVQSYVFCLLFLIFLNDSFFLH
jgi:ATP synthase subunit 6